MMNMPSINSKQRPVNDSSNLISTVYIETKTTATVNHRIHLKSKLVVSLFRQPVQPDQSSEREFLGARMRKETHCLCHACASSTRASLLQGLLCKLLVRSPFRPSNKMVITEILKHFFPTATHLHPSMIATDQTPTTIYSTAPYQTTVWSKY